MNREEKLQNSLENTAKNSKIKVVELAQKALSKNDENALKLRALWDKDGKFSINLMSSPGSGKTTLLENLKTKYNLDFVVIDGDLQTSRDADRLKDKGIEAVMILTGDACHLEANMVNDAYLKIREKSKDKDLVFVENVGNLVCPASYNLGCNLNIALLSTPEGDDKVLKYPTMFLGIDCLLVSKIEFCEIFNFDLKRVQDDLNKLNSKAKIIPISSVNGDGLEDFIKFIQEKRGENYVSSHTF